MSDLSWMLKKCPHCFEEIPHNEKVCPYCNKKIYKSNIILNMIGLVVLVWIASRVYIYIQWLLF